MTAALPDIDLLLRHQDWVRALARSLVADPSRADDVAQQTMLEAIERPPQDLSKPKGWLATVARNTARALARQDRRRTDREQAVAKADEGSESAADYAQRAAAHKQVVDAVFELPEPYHSVILLRYFEDLDAHGIAKQLQRPVATVRTQLQRGLDRMRQKLDRDFGNRQAWCTALLPLFAKKHAVASVPILTSLGALAMWKWTLPAIVAIASLFFIMPMLESVEDPAPPVNEPVEAERAELPTPQPAVPKRTEAPTANVAAAPANAPAVASVSGRLLSMAGAPLSVTAIEYVGSRWPKLEGDLIKAGNRVWSASAESRAQLQSDEAALARFLATFAPFGEEAASLMRGETIIPPRTTTDVGGNFTFERLDKLVAADLRLDDNTRIVTGSGRLTDGTQVFLVGEAVHVAGRVVHEDGRPADCWVSFYCPADRLPGYAQQLASHDGQMRRSIRTDAGGHFDLGDVPRLKGLDVSATDMEWRSARIESTKIDGPVILTLRDPKRTGKDLLGLVYNADGSIAAGAEIRFGQARTTADGNGRFAMRVRSFDYDDESDLIAYRPGIQPAVIAGFGTRYRNDRKIRPTLRLGGATLSISGRVVDSDGNGQPGVRILLGDGMPFGNQNHSVESVLGNRRLKPVLTDRTGAFTITGLLQRDYVLRAIKQSTLLVLVSDPVAAGTTDLVLTQPAQPFFARLEGEVVDERGVGIKGAKISVMTEVERGRRGNSSISRAGPPATADENGRFALQNCPRRHVHLFVFGDGVVSQSIDIEDIELPPRIVAKRQFRFRIRSYGGGAGTHFAIHDKDGKQLAFTAIVVNTNETTMSYRIPTSDSPVFKVSEDAATLVITHRSKTVSQVPLHLRRDELNELDL